MTVCALPTRVPRDVAPAAELRVVAAGDLMNHPYLTASSEALYCDVDDLIFDADVSVANLECVVQEGAVAFETDMRSEPLVLDADAFRVARGHGARRSATYVRRAEVVAVEQSADVSRRTIFLRRAEIVS